MVEVCRKIRFTREHQGLRVGFFAKIDIEKIKFGSPVWNIDNTFLTIWSFKIELNNKLTKDIQLSCIFLWYSQLFWDEVTINS